MKKLVMIRHIIDVRMMREDNYSVVGRREL